MVSRRRVERRWLKWQRYIHRLGKVAGEQAPMTGGMWAAFSTRTNAHNARVSARAVKS